METTKSSKTDRRGVFSAERVDNGVRVEQMTLERAREIVAAMTGHKYWKLGIVVAVPQSLVDLSLAEMVEANRMVREDGKKVQTVYDDRLVAALYVLYHHRPDMTILAIVHDGHCDRVDVLPVISDLEAEGAG